MLLPALGSVLTAIFLHGPAEAPPVAPEAEIIQAYATARLISPEPVGNDLKRGFLNALNKQYPTNDCPSGFRSNLRKFPEVEICVTYSDFRGACKRLTENAFNCQVAFTIAVASPTHPGVLKKLKATTTEIEREDFIFTHDWRGWRWKAAGDAVDALVPAEFRGRQPFSREEALAH
ncbi:hypothetical protein KUV47_01240 [Vannielia litorea]|uniref:hypothetical protein n=1 Tax=Vannielia litorea TaxID=1217970 RepID=UPI001C953539|nr:hypothetical protein [Vannielia litorea]MBY6151821.1 hypothetical protein [Vannielia litorea]